MKKNPYLILGIVFTAIAAIELIVIAVLVIINPPKAGLIALPFAIQCPIFGGIGIGFLIYLRRKFLLREQLISNGYYELATIVSIEQNHYVRVNRCYPYHVVCRIERNGVLHEYRSEAYPTHPGVQVGELVPVYLDGQNERRYYVAVDSIAPQIVRH